MIKTISQNEFINDFRNSETYKNNFTYEGLEALFNYFEELEDSIGKQIEFDMVSICCEYTEYENLKEAYSQYEGYGMSEKELEEVSEDFMRTYFKDITQVIEFDGGVIIQKF